MNRRNIVVACLLASQGTDGYSCRLGRCSHHTFRPLSTARSLISLDRSTSPSNARRGHSLCSLLSSPRGGDNNNGGGEGAEDELPQPPQKYGIIPNGDTGGEREEELTYQPPPPGKTFGFIPPTFSKTYDESTFLKNTLMTNFMFQSLPDKTLDKLVSAFEKVTYLKKSTIINQGETSIDYFYVLFEGECAVTIDNKKLPDPYGTLTEGTVFGELAMLYNVPRSATVSAKMDCTLYRVDRRTFRYFLDSQQPREREDVKAELREIDSAIDKIAGVKTRYSGAIIRQYKPQRSWLWRRWRGTVLQHAYKGALCYMLITAALNLFIRRRLDCTWALGVVPDQTHPIICRMAAFSKHWHYLQNITTFILTFFLSQSYALWREMYSTARKIQGRLNDVGLLLASTATRNETGYYTPEAEQVLDDVASYMRLFHAFMWATFCRNFNILLQPRGMSRMLSRGLMTQADFNALQNVDRNVGPSNACLEWITIRAMQGMEDGGLKEDQAMKHVLWSKLCDLRGTYACIGDILDGRIPLAYTHIVQVLVDSFLATAPFALYAELGVWSIFSVGIITVFYSGLLDLAKIFLDPLDNDDFLNESVNMDIGVLIREGNLGSTRWKNGAFMLPFSTMSKRKSKSVATTDSL